LDDGRQPEHDAERAADQQRASERSRDDVAAPASTASPNRGRQRNRSRDGDTWKQPDVCLHEEASDDDEPGQGPDIETGHRPCEEQHERERQDRDAGVPHVERHRAQREQVDPERECRPHDERPTASSRDDDEHAHHRAGVDRDRAEHHADGPAAQQPVEDGEEVEVDRSRVVEVESRIRPEEDTAGPNLAHRQSDDRGVAEQVAASTEAVDERVRGDREGAQCDDGSEHRRDAEPPRRSCLVRPLALTELSGLVDRPRRCRV
jgi:hypothetical protein